ncbi:MAG: hypothetical protein U5M51_15610 [Emticicia sp.]|nr:hypothetical protein [Emticicia sp.]
MAVIFHQFFKILIWYSENLVRIPLERCTFICGKNDSFTTIEIFVLPNLRNIAESILDKLLDGDFDTQIEALRTNAKPYFDYV